jgi:two-component sensor histidine kinase
MTADGAGAGSSSLSIQRLRTLILIALVVGVSVFTGVMFTLVQSLSERFGPQVEADLAWRALRGPQELAKAADLGLAVSDAAMVTEAFGAYAESSDVQAIVAIDVAGKQIASHGTIASIAPVFARPPNTLVHGDGYVASWAPAAIEGSVVGKIAVVVSTRRLGDAHDLLVRVSRTTLIAGLAGATLGALVLWFFTRAVSLRDLRLNDYAHNLEHKVEVRTRELDERNRGMRLVLDNVAQGFITVDLHGVMASERSAIVDQWFGTPAPEATFGDLIGARNLDLTTWFALGLEGIREGFMPLELCLEQMPRRFTMDARTFEIAYSPIMEGAEVARILVIISDVTEHISRERTEREQRETVLLFQQITGDRAGFEEFLDEAANLISTLSTIGDPAVERRALHTLKGTCAIYGLESYAELCHSVESELSDATSPIPPEQRQALAAGWRRVTAQMARLLGEVRRDVVEVRFAELSRAIDSAKQGMPSRELAAVLTSWSHEPVRRRFERLAAHATSLAHRLGKGDVEVEISDDEIRLDTSRWAGFWSAMVHAVRNAVDHGIEAPELRAQAGKPKRPKLTFVATRARGRLVISVSDDGAGIDWAAVRDKANRLGLPSETSGDLERAVFADGFSTSAAATQTSGRGVGMSALRAAVTALGGTVELESRLSAGTTLRFQFPEADAQLLTLRPPTQPMRTFG